MAETSPRDVSDLLHLTADIVAAHAAHNSVAVGELPRLIDSVHAALSGLNMPQAPEEAPVQPAVSVRASIKPDHLVCLEDGVKVKMLKRHLMTHHDLTPDAYRAKWKLPATYPMVAPNYSAQRKALALSFGLGRKPGAVSKNETKTPGNGAPDATPASAPKSAERRRKLGISAGKA